MSEFIYLYGFVPPDSAAPVALPGIAEGPVRLLPAGDVSAVISEVPADAYAPERVEERLKDLTWVAEQGAAHERVVAWFVDQGQILPAPLFTMYSSTDALHATVRQRNDELRSELERLRGQREWDLKVSFDETAMETGAARLSPQVAQLDREIADATAGKGYLLRKKRADLVRNEVRMAAHARATEVLQALQPHVAELRTLPLPRTDDVLPVVLHAALLVSNEQEAHVVALLENERRALDELGMSLTFSGPWAPYRFAGGHE